MPEQRAPVPSIDDIVAHFNLACRDQLPYQMRIEHQPTSGYRLVISALLALNDDRPNGASVLVAAQRAAGAAQQHALVLAAQTLAADTIRTPDALGEIFEPQTSDEREDWRLRDLADAATDPEVGL